MTWPFVFFLTSSSSVFISALLQIFKALRASTSTTIISISIRMNTHTHTHTHTIETAEAAAAAHFFHVMCTHSFPEWLIKSPSSQSRNFECKENYCYAQRVASPPHSHYIPLHCRSIVIHLSIFHGSTDPKRRRRKNCICWWFFLVLLFK